MATSGNIANDTEGVKEIKFNFSLKKLTQQYHSQMKHVCQATLFCNNIKREKLDNPITTGMIGGKQLWKQASPDKP